MNILNLFSLWNRARGTDAPPAPIRLRHRQLWSAAMGAGHSVTCQSGVVWLTHSGDSSDIILRAGQSFTATRRGKLVAQAMGDAVLCATSAPLPRSSKRQCSTPALRTASGSRV